MGTFGNSKKDFDRNIGTFNSSNGLCRTPVALFYSFIIIAIFFLVNHVRKWKKVFRGTLIGFLIAGVQIVPFLFLKVESVRDKLNYEQFLHGNLPIECFFSFLTPFGTDYKVTIDNYIHFGTLAFLFFIVSPFFYNRSDKPLRKIYFTGIILFVLGIILSLGNGVPILPKILYRLPVFNIIRVPARYILISHFGVLLSLTAFFAYLLDKHKRISIIFSAAIIINSLFIPTLFLERHEISEAKNQYLPELKKIIEKSEQKKLSINSPPTYFLSSSFFLFPNRHILNFMPNVIGYNPMILKQYYESFPVAPVGSFENSDYFIDLYETFQIVGLKYYIFPTPDFLKQKNIKGKEIIYEYLRKQEWENIATLKNDFVVWKNPVSKPFIYFLEQSNKINSIDFWPGKIALNVEAEIDDNLIVNQTFTPDWMISTNLDQNERTAQKYQNIVQSYG